MKKPTVEEEILIIQKKLPEDGVYLDSFPKDTIYFICTMAKKGHFVMEPDGIRIIVRSPKSLK